MIQNTSIDAWVELQPELGTMQNMIFNIIKIYPGSSNLDISRITDKPINSVTPRVKELRDRGLVILSHYKTDRITNRKVMCWTAVPMKTC